MNKLEVKLNEKVVHEVEDIFEKGVVFSLNSLQHLPTDSKSSMVGISKIFYSILYKEDQISPQNTQHGSQLVVGDVIKLRFY